MRILEGSFAQQLIELCCLALIPFVVNQSRYPGMEIVKFRVRIKELLLQGFCHMRQLKLEEPVQQNVFFRRQLRIVCVVFLSVCHSRSPLLIEVLSSDVLMLRKMFF